MYSGREQKYASCTSERDGVYLWIFVQIALSLFATSTDMGFVFLLGDDRRAGKPCLKSQLFWDALLPVYSMHLETA